MKKRLMYLLGAGLLLRIILGLFGQWGHPTDQTCFWAWAETMRQVGPVSFYETTSFCDYPPGYLYLLYPIGWLLKLTEGVAPLSSLILRLPAIAADLVIACLLSKIALKQRGEKAALITAAVALFNPLMILNSAVWAQIDSVWCLFLILAIYMKDNRIKSAAMLAVSVLIKPQALLFFPIMAAFYFDREHPVREYAKALITGIGIFLIATLPFCKGNYLLIVDKYLGTMTEGYRYATINAFNLYGLFGANWTPLDQSFLFATYQFWGNVMIGVGVILGFLYYFLWKKGPWISAAMMMTTLFLFATMMHERYWYPAILLLLAAYADRPDENKKLLNGYVFASIANFFNVAIALKFALMNNAAIPYPTIVFFSFLTLLSGGYLYYILHKKLSLKKAEVIKMKELEPIKQWNKTKIEILLVALITLVYSMVSFFRLGDAKAPQTFWETQSGTILRVDLGQEYELSRLCVYTGISHANYEFYIADSPTGEQQQIIRFEEPYCFSWHQADTNLTGRYLFIRVLDLPGSIGEIAVYDANDVLISIPSDPDWEFIVDEQEVAVYHPTYQNSTYFDEIYHARTAYEFIHGISPYETTHPPLGKVLISIGISLFGMTPFGWRFIGTLFGCIMLPIFYLLCKQLLKDGKLAVLGCGLFALDFMHFSQTRIATIDTYAIFFILLMTLFMVKYLQTHSYRSLGLCGIAFGLGAASKWTCIYAGAGLAVLFFVDLWMNRKENNFKSIFIKRCSFCLIFFVLIPLILYALSYLPWTKCEGQSWQTVWNNQFDMYNYHSQLVAEHGYSSPWYEWLIMVKPMVFYRQETLTGGISTIATFGNPIIWWGGLVALIAAVVLGIRKRDKTVWIIVCSYLAQLLPWVLVTRIVFIYHYFNCTPFLILSILYMINHLRHQNPKTEKPLIWGIVGGAAILFLAFYPVLSGFEAPYEYVLNWLCWFPQWYFV
ncbi:MAG: phospholipid carrier-dependent glycosyltransferase [Ruminococcaceae bacterium]|nr:phospholipid carrier-dependent glycosyltransferase [Oscillospiraceae bacterium]